MNIWNAYCEPKYYNLYFRVLAATTGNAGYASNLKQQYQNDLTRLKDVPLFIEKLKSAETPTDFIKVIKFIFEEKWVDHIKYIEMPHHYVAYCEFLESVQAIYNDFINDDEKRRLLQTDQPIKSGKLSKYELNYMKNGKLVALMNPKLLHILQEDLSEIKKLKLSACGSTCKRFYGDLLPEMTVSDYVNLVKKIWDSNRKPSGTQRKSLVKIVFPEGETTSLSPHEALCQVIEYYSFDKAKKLNTIVRNRNLLLNRQPFAEKEKYKEYLPGKFIFTAANSQDWLKATIAINLMLGNKLKITQESI